MERMSERGKTNKQNQVDQLNRDLLNMLDGTARPAGRMRMNGSTGRDTDILMISPVISKNRPELRETQQYQIRN